MHGCSDAHHAEHILELLYGLCIPLQPSLVFFGKKARTVIFRAHFSHNVRFFFAGPKSVRIPYCAQGLGEYMANKIVGYFPDNRLKYVQRGKNQGTNLSGTGTKKSLPLDATGRPRRRPWKRESWLVGSEMWGSKSLCGQ